MLLQVLLVWHRQKVCFVWFIIRHNILSDSLQWIAMTNSTQSIEPDTNYLNEVFEPGFSNNLGKNVRLVSDYNSPASSSENDSVMMQLNTRSFGVHIYVPHAYFDNSTAYPHVMVLSETWFSKQSISEVIRKVSRDTTLWKLLGSLMEYLCTQKAVWTLIFAWLVLYQPRYWGKHSQNSNWQFRGLHYWCI